jgi:hypothetical protein
MLTEVYGAIEATAAIVAGVRKADQFATPQSLSTIAESSRVEPLCLVDSDLTHLEYTPMVMQAMQNMFAGYYINALNMMTTIDGVSVASKLGQLNPNRKLTEMLEGYAFTTISKESYAMRLPMRDKKSKGFALESNNDLSYIEKRIDSLHDDLDKTKDRILDNVSGNDSKGSNAGIKDTTKDLTELTPLCIGKVYNVDIQEGSTKGSMIKATIQVAIRVFANQLSSDSMVNLFTFKNNFDMSFKERWHAWRSGRLEFFKDLLLCRDLIKKHRNTLIHDKSGIYKEIVSRQSGNTIMSILTGKPSLATISNLAVISENTAKRIEAELGSRLSKEHTRDLIFKNTNVMILCVVDTEYEHVTFYHYGISTGSTCSLSDLKKKKDGDIGDVLKAFAQGMAPRI